jgi:hypothetical protein
VLESLPHARHSDSEREGQFDIESQWLRHIGCSRAFANDPGHGRPAPGFR